MTDRLQLIKTSNYNIDDIPTIVSRDIEWLIQEVERLKFELNVEKHRSDQLMLERNWARVKTAKRCAEIVEADIGHNHPDACQNTCNIAAGAIRKEFLKC